MSGLAGERCLARTAAAVVAVTALAAAAAATSPAAARQLWAQPPHPVLAGNTGEVTGVLATNLPALCVPLLLAATLAGQGRGWRLLGDLIVGAIMVANAGLVGAALGS